MKKAEIKGVIVSDDEKWIYDFFGVKSCSPADVSKVLTDAAGDDVVIEINSCGGDLFAGSEIYSALERYGGNVVVDIVGLAASAASIIAMAGNDSRISCTGAVMVHNVSSYAEGDYHDMQKKAAVLETLNKSVAAAYRKKTGREYKELLAMMDAETWLDAEKAVELGLVNRIYGTEDKAVSKGALFAASAASMLPRALIEQMLNKRAKAKAKINLLTKTRRKENV